jgi:hypothetical protein
MNRRKLGKLKLELVRLRRGPRKASELEKFAKALGRKRVNRGKEPVWDNPNFQDVSVLSIPHHGARDLSPGTQRNILDLLEGDILAWDEKLADLDADESDQGTDDDEIN